MSLYFFYFLLHLYCISIIRNSECGIICTPLVFNRNRRGGFQICPLLPIYRTKILYSSCTYYASHQNSVNLSFRYRIRPYKYSVLHLIYGAKIIPNSEFRIPNLNNYSILHNFSRIMPKQFYLCFPEKRSKIEKSAA